MKNNFWKIALFLISIFVCLSFLLFCSCCATKPERPSYKFNYLLPEDASSTDVCMSPEDLLELQTAYENYYK